jgi:membrane-bound lytic murein transglycosylase D
MQNIFIYFNKLARLFIVIPCLMLAASCQQTSLHPPGMGFAASSSRQSLSFPPARHPVIEQSPQEKEQVEELATPTATGQPDDLWERIRLDLTWQDVDNTQIDSAREVLLRQPTYLPEVAGRADYYLYYIVEEVQKRGMPMEIALLPMIESTLNPFASSPSGAAGLWQIMPETGIHLGLEQDSWYDGRHALRDSTTVALDYLETLHEQFGNDWLLALAAYNCGAGNVMQAREANAAKGLDTDYWSLDLPAQASNFVPKIIALAQVIAEPEEFNVDIPAVDNAPSFEVADTQRPMKLSEAAKLAGVDVDTLRALNPGQLRESISPNRPAELLLPVGTRARFEYNIAQLSPEEIVQWQTYRIKPGDSLGHIAQKFDTEVAVLKEVNGIRGNSIQAGDTLKIPADSDQGPEQMLAANGVASPRGYQVRSGDSLYGIAGKFKVSIDDIIAWNELDPRAHLKPGQKLTLYVKGG